MLLNPQRQHRRTMQLPSRQAKRMIFCRVETSAGHLLPLLRARWILAIITGWYKPLGPIVPLLLQEKPRPQPLKYQEVMKETYQVRSLPLDATAFLSSIESHKPSLISEPISKLTMV